LLSLPYSVQIGRLLLHSHLQPFVILSHPTRRSSDLRDVGPRAVDQLLPLIASHRSIAVVERAVHRRQRVALLRRGIVNRRRRRERRRNTRQNSRRTSISYAVLCATVRSRRRLLHPQL